MNKYQQRKMKSLNKTIPLRVYPFDVMISFNESGKKVRKVLGKYGIYPEPECILWELDRVSTEQGRAVMFITNQIIIRLNFYPRLKNPVHMSMLQHEIFHAVEFLMRELRSRLTRDSSESYGYLVQYLTKKIYQLIK